jgi:serine/threonine protein kinase
LANEIEHLKQLDYTSCILQLYEVYNTKNNTYIITELCDSDLSKKIKKKLKEQEALNYITQLIEGYLHLYRK